MGIEPVIRSVDGDAVDPGFHDVMAALSRLDRLLAGAVRIARTVYGQEAAVDPYRGLYISDEDVDRLLDRPPGTPILYAGGRIYEEPSRISQGVSKLDWFRQSFNLTPFDMDLVLIALAPEIDLRYERLYAYLQDDVNRKRPTVELALNLLSASLRDKIRRRSHLTSHAPLIRERILHLVADSHIHEPPLPAYYMRLDAQIVGLLLAQTDLDPRLTTFCRKIEPAMGLQELVLDDEIKGGLQRLVQEAGGTRRPLRLYLHGPVGAGKRETAEALAGEIGAPLLAADLERIAAAGDGVEACMRILFREARFQEALLYLEKADVIRADKERAGFQQTLLDQLAEHDGITVLAGAEPWTASTRECPGMLSVRVPVPGFVQRRKRWRDGLAVAGVGLDDGSLDTLAGRFRLTPAQIDASVALAVNRSLWVRPERAGRKPGGEATVDLVLEDLFSAARDRSHPVPEGLARRIQPRYAWRDIVLPEDTLAQLWEICRRVAFQHRVLGDWGFDRKLSTGKGVSALFSGPSGTGKTMAAEIIARELGLDLYKIDLSGVVSKYVGETEKNLARIFRAAESANAILFFDEADALFGRRSEVHDSHDRYANIEISYLLQKMEEYDGAAILATNLPQHLDAAFKRRLAFFVHFPFPDESSRRKIWTAIWPRECPLAKEFDPDLLARRYKLSGGNIKNIVLAAAFLAAADGNLVGMPHLMQALRREYQKMGKPLNSEGSSSGIPETGHEETSATVR